MSKTVSRSMTKSKSKSKAKRKKRPVIRGTINKSDSSHSIHSKSSKSGTFKYDVGAKIVYFENDNLFEAVIKKRRFDDFQFYLVHFLPPHDTNEDKWVIEDKIMEFKDPAPTQRSRKLRNGKVVNIPTDPSLSGVDGINGINAMNSGMNSGMNAFESFDTIKPLTDPKFMYSEGQNVLCWSQGKLYPARILKRSSRPHHKDKTKWKISYLVHYHGYNKRWDEEVDETNLLTDSLQNRELMDPHAADGEDEKEQCKDAQTTQRYGTQGPPRLISSKIQFVWKKFYYKQNIG